MPYADEFDMAAAINDMANTLDQAASGGGHPDWGMSGSAVPMSGEQAVANINAAGGWGGGAGWIDPNDEMNSISLSNAMRQDREMFAREESLLSTNPDMFNSEANQLAAAGRGAMDWGKGPEGSEGTIDLGQNPSLQALQAALSGGGVDPLAGKEDFMQQNEPATDAAQAGADVNAFLEATRGSDIRRQEELGTTPRGPNTLNAPPIQGGDNRGDNPIDIIRSTYAWATSLPNNVLFNAARYPDYLRLLIESDAAGKALPLDMPASMAAEGSG